MADTNLSFNILAKDNASRSVDNVGKSMGRLGKVAGGLGKVMKVGAIAVGALAVGAAASAPKVFGMAASLDLVGKKSKTVFGAQLGLVEKWAKTNANAMGLTSTQATGLAANFADLLIPMGFNRKEAAKMSTDVVGLSGALAEWSGGTKTAAEVADTLSKAMLGERDELKSLGISITDADVKARLAAKGQGKLTGAALQQAVAIATQEMILEKSTDAQAAFANGQGTLARKLAESKARFRELGEELLTKATPALLKIFDSAQKFTGWISGKMQPVLGSLVGVFKAEVLPRLREFAGFIKDSVLPRLREFAGFVKDQFVSQIVPAVKNLVATFGPLVIEVGQKLVGAFKVLAPLVAGLGKTIATNIGPALKSFTGFLLENKTIVQAVTVGIGAIVGALLLYKGALGVVHAATKAFAVVQAALNVVMSLNPIGIVVLALVGLAAGLVFAYKESETFRKVVDGAFGAVKTAVSSVVGFFKDLPGDISKAVGDTSKTLVSKGKNFVIGLVSGFVAYLRFIGGIGAWVLRNVVTPVVNVFAKAGQWLLGAGRLVISGLVAGFVAYLRFIGGVGRWLLDNVATPAIRAFGKAGEWLLGAGRLVISGLVAGFSAYLKAISGVGRWLLDNVATPAIRVFGKAGEWLVNAGKNVLGGFWSGLTEKWETVKKWVGDIATWIKDHKGPVSLDGQLLIPAGKAIMSGFLKGLQSGAGKAWEFVQSIGGKSKDALAAALGIGSKFIGSGGGGGAGVQRWRNVALRALMTAGAPVEWIDSLMRRMNQESGGNPNAINLWDSNAKAGRPSQGLMQTIPGTFAAYAGPYRDRGITDPFANIYAAIKYTIARYGSGPDGWDRPGGYRQGTPWVPDDQLAFLHRGEAVIPAEVNRARLQGGVEGAKTVVLHMPASTEAAARAAADRIVAALGA